MVQIKSFPDLGRAFECSKLKDKLDEIPPIGALAVSIKWAMDNKKPLPDVCKLILSNYESDPVDTIFVVGQDTFNLIKKMYDGK